jgi:nicotinamidase/pyrazinamidase
MKALIIADIQYDFLPDGALGVPDGDKIIPLVNDIQKQFPLVVATQDWHPPRHRSFASTHRGKDVMETIMLGDIEQILWPDHCVQGTRGSALSDELSLHNVAAIFRKGMSPEIDSYSAFYDNEHKKSTGLSDYLKGKGVTEVYVCGLAGDFCVAYTALDALKEGFETYLVEDATRPIDADGFEKIKKQIREKGGKVIMAADI